MDVFVLLFIEFLVKIFCRQTSGSLLGEINIRDVVGKFKYGSVLRFRPTREGLQS